MCREEIRYETDDFLYLVRAMLYDENGTIIQIVKKADVSMLQALVDIGESMQRIAYAEANERNIHLFTAFKTMLLQKGE